MTIDNIHCKYDEILEAAELHPNPRNPNQHRDAQIALLSKILTEQGWRNPVVVSKDSGLIVSGHGRVLAALKMEDKSVPVNFQSFDTEADEWAHLLADNRLSELSEFDFKSVSEILKKLEEEGTDLDLTGFFDYEADPLLKGDWTPAELSDLDLGGTEAAQPIKMTTEQRQTFDQCATQIRGDEGEPELSDGRIVELISADYLSA